MRVAIVDHVVNYGGGSRVLRCLLPAIRELRPDWELHFYGNRAALMRDGLAEEFEALGIKVKFLKSAKFANAKIFSKVRGGKALIALMQKRYERALSLLPLYFSGAIHKEYEQIAKEYDLLFCTWPYFARAPQVKIPVVAIFHDFNFRYYFNGTALHPSHFKFLQEEIPRWLRVANPVVSTHFMKAELEKFYPEFSGRAEVIHLSSLGAETEISQSEAEKVVKEMGISGPYLLYPTNTSPHKNLGSLIGAFHLLHQKHPELKLVFAGYGTESVNGRAGLLGLEVGDENRNVIGFGYVSNLQMDALIQCATLVVSTSLYEAGCGPGLDAWQRAVPVAMSDIPPFTEHMEVQGVKAALFNPRSSPDIAEKIDALLSNPQKAAEEALLSQARLSAYDWKSVAQKYINLFEKSYAHSRL
ncbi:MAG: glycosyltransferase [Chlamydiales bacterium]|nr:glycosyltransferase [Chlamydiales bacterium]